jgi:copper chaperone CopZ
METTTLWILGMSCGADRDKLRAALLALPGVSGARVDLAANEADITYDPNQISTAALRQAVLAAGFGLSPYPVPEARGVG